MKHLLTIGKTVTNTLKTLFVGATRSTDFGDLRIDLTMDEVMEDLAFGRDDVVKPAHEAETRYHYRLAA